MYSHLVLFVVDASSHFLLNAHYASFCLQYTPDFNTAVCNVFFIVNKKVNVHLIKLNILKLGLTSQPKIHSRLPPLRPGFDPRHGRKWESW